MTKSRESTEEWIEEMKQLSYGDFVKRWKAEHPDRKDLEESTKAMWNLLQAQRDLDEVEELFEAFQDDNAPRH